MQTQDAPAEIVVKLWPWLEANQKRLIYAAVAAVAVFFVWFYLSTQKQQAEINAGLDYTKYQMNLAPGLTPQQIADGYVKIADKNSGTAAALRARLEAATILFGAARYADAQPLFQKVASDAKAGDLVIQARLGVASCLEAQGKLDEALSGYRAAAGSQSESAASLFAKFSQARVLELQGKLSEAVSAYQEVTRSPLAGSAVASEAGQRAVLLQTKLAAVAPAPKS
jgi:predicted negative regulator of RcsB-dependent stress response